MGEATIDREQAYALLCRYNKENFHLKHARTLEGVMRYFAQTEGYAEEADFWAVAGLLHDLDFELWPQEHCIKEQELMRREKLPPRLIRACASHGFGICADIPPEHQMEKILYAVDELTGLIGAVARVRPSKSVMDLEVKSVKKKFKQPSFAAGCSRDVISNGAALLGWDLDQLIEKTICAMRTLEREE